MSTHYLEKHSYKGSYGDHPEPWEVTFLCGLCREELWTETEGYGSTAGDPEEALEAHIRGVEGHEEGEDEELDAAIELLSADVAPEPVPA